MALTSVACLVALLVWLPTSPAVIVIGPLTRTEVTELRRLGRSLIWQDIKFDYQRNGRDFRHWPPLIKRVALDRVLQIELERADSAVLVTGTSLQSSNALRTLRPCVRTNGVWKPAPPQFE